MNASHTIERCEEVTGTVLHAVFNALYDQKVSLGATRNSAAALGRYTSSMENQSAVA
jgi:fructose-bisphosphate aldolase class 1